MKYNVAAVSFLNTIPIIDQLMSKSSDEIDLHFDIPSRLAALLESGAADVALVPVVEVFRGRAAGIIPGTGIACRGAVDSVRLFYRGELATLQRIHADRGSRSSVALLRILLAENYAIKPPIEETIPTMDYLPPEGEGILVIGDRCFEFEKHLETVAGAKIKYWDLGQAWWDLTGLPFVFAVWAASKAFYARSTAAEFARLAVILNGARDDGLERLDDLAAREAALGRLGYKGDATADAVAYYFRESLQYHIGPEEVAGMIRFHKYCIEYGVVPDGPPPLMLEG